MLGSGSESRLVVASAAQQRSLILSYAVGLPGVLLLLLYVGLRASGQPGDLEFLVPVLAMNAFTLPLLLWRNVIVIDKAAGRVTHWWGFPFWKRGRVDYPLGPEVDVLVGDALPYWSVPGGGRIVPPLTGDGFANVGRFRYYEVWLASGEHRIRLREFHYFSRAHALLVRARRFLGLPVPEVHAEWGSVPAGLHVALTRLAAMVGLFAGCIFGLTVAASFFAEGAGRPLIDWLRATLPFRGWGIPFLVSLFVVGGVLGFGFAVNLVGLIPARCPPCGGRAYLGWEPAWLRGFGFSHYRCRRCGIRWYPPPRG